MHACTGLVIASSRFERLVAKFIREVIEKETKNVESVGREQKISSSSAPNSPAVSESAVAVELRNPARIGHVKTDRPRGDDWKSHLKHMKSSSSSSSSHNLSPSTAVSEVGSIKKRRKMF